MGKIFSPAAGGQWGIGFTVGVGYAKAPPAGPSAVGAAARALVRYGLTTGSTEASLVFEAPAYLRDWKFALLARGERMQRTPFFGLTNESPRNDSLQELYGNLYYRYSLLRFTGFGVVHRRLVGSLWALAGGHIRHYRSSPLKQRPTLFEAAVSSPAIPDTIRRNGTELRFGLVLDTRDDWSASTRGLYLEAIVAPGKLRAHAPETGLTYTRYLLGAREFFRLSPSGRTILALRQKVALASDSLPFFLAYEQTGSWLPYDGIVSGRGMRLHGGGTQMASNHALATIELRRKLVLPTDNPLREAGIWGYVFADGALLWEPGERASLKRNEWTIGTGLRIQFGPGSIVGIDFGIGDDGPNIAILSGFAF